MTVLRNSSSSLSRLASASMSQRTDLGAGEASWLRMIGHQFRANADHYAGPDAEFSLDQFAFHPFSQLGGLPQALRAFGTQERVDGLLAGLNHVVFGGATGPDPGGNPAAAAPAAGFALSLPMIG
jgi:type I restriction enzyme R subunit